LFLQKAFQKESEEIGEGVELAIPTYVFVSIFLLSSSISKITFSEYFFGKKSHFREDYHILPSHVGEGQGWGQYSEISADVMRLQTPPLTPPLEGRGVP